MRIQRRVVPVGDYLRLRAEAGWWPVDEAAAEASLDRSAFAATAVHGTGVIGCARVAGDPMYFHVLDVIVAARWRGCGVGSALMAEVMAFLADAAVEGTWVGLMCARGQRGFYERFGFEVRPAGAPGMQRRF